MKSASLCKTLSKPMRLEYCAAAAVLFLFVSADLVVAADSEFKIRGISRTTAAGWVKVDDGWVDRAEVLKVRFSVNTGHQGRIPLTAGFFNTEKKMLRKITQVPHLQMRHGTDYQELPAELEANRIYEIYFPVPPSIASGSMRWSDFLIRLGEGETAVIASYPKSGLDWEGYSLDGKEIQHAGTAVEGEDVILEFGGINRQRHANNVWVNGKWHSGVNVLRSRIGIQSGAASGGFYVRAYFFDREGTCIHTEKSPPQIELRRGSEYVTLPVFWENNEPYEVYFPIPPELELGSGRYENVVIVFGNKDSAVAGVFPTSRVDINTLDFPERSLVQVTAGAEAGR